MYYWLKHEDKTKGSVTPFYLPQSWTAARSFTETTSSFSLSSPRPWLTSSSRLMDVVTPPLFAAAKMTTSSTEVGNIYQMFCLSRLYHTPTHQELKVACWTRPVSCSSPSSSSSPPPVGFTAAGVRLQSEPPCEDPGGRYSPVEHRFWKSCSTTEESASVEMSPRSRSSQAILRSTRRMILPDLVLGSPGAFWM